ncbi:MAG: hypothetical protein M3Y06_02840, partial [Actinomycetota bacterium]|nr:hypothetical protein [Actinomycetota bacterium]
RRGRSRSDGTGSGRPPRQLLPWGPAPATPGERPDDPFWDLPNTVVTAHISGSTNSPWYLERIWELFLANADRRASGHPMLNVIKHDDLDLAHGSDQ